jgi:dUTP pyrophosphatase
MKKIKNNMDLLDKMREKVLLLADLESGYTQEDFDKEFNTINVDDYSHKIKLAFKNESNNPDPEYATAGSSGFDLRANLESPIVLESGEYKLIKTGLYFEIPNNMEITIRSRSGLAYKHGIAVLNGIGTIDSDYTGEIGVLLINHGKENFIIEHGDRIAQGVLSSVIGKNLINLKKIDNINENTERGSGGFGSSGVK